MKNFLYFLVGVILCVGALDINWDDILPANKEKKGEAKIEQMRSEQDRELAEKNRRWVKDNEVTARNLAKKFAQDKGYTIQSIHATSNSASDYYASEITWAYYSYRIVTGDISNSGGLIDIGVRVRYDKYESPNWTIDYFQAYN